jgi:hypothetical protein
MIKNDGGNTQPIDEKKNGDKTINDENEDDK